MKNIVVRSLLYYLRGLTVASLLGFFYAGLLYPIAFFSIPSAMREAHLAHGILDSALTLVELFLLLPEIIITGVAALFQIHLGYTSILVAANNFPDGFNFVTCQLLLFIVTLFSYCLSQVLANPTAIASGSKAVVMLPPSQKKKYR